VRRALGILLLTVAVLQVGIRGMQRVRSDIPLWDFVSVHSAARTWIHGGDPYDLPAVVVTWRESGIFTDRDVSYFATVYPPTSLLSLVPLALLPAKAAMALWLLLTLVLLAAQFHALGQMAQLSWRDPRMLILVGGALASAPLQFGILSGQLSLPAISACILAFWCASQKREALAGVLLGLACAVKVQIAAPFILYYLFLRRFKTAGVAILVGAVIGAVALIAMHLSHIDWLAGWKHSVAVTEQLGAVNDYGWANRFRDEIIDLKLVLVSFLHDTLALRIAVSVIVITLLAWYVSGFPRGQARTSRTELLTLAALSAISLLPIYHRVYDATLLTMALAWALAELDGPRRSHAMLILAPMLLLLIPFDFVLTAGRRVPWLVAHSRTWWWQSLLAPHYAWAVLVLAVVLVWVMSRRNPA
jgi:hypothetical protein